MITTDSYSQAACSGRGRSDIGRIEIKCIVSAESANSRIGVRAVNENIVVAVVENDVTSAYFIDNDVACKVVNRIADFTAHNIFIRICGSYGASARCNIDCGTF